MSTLNNIKNSFVLTDIFLYIDKIIKLKILRYNKTLQKRIDLCIFNYQENVLYDIPKIEFKNLLNYYDYLKRSFINTYPLETIKKYFVEFFCRFLSANNIIYELDSTNELITDILLCEKLEKIKIVIQIENHKTGIIDNSIYDKNKKPFVKLFQMIFNNPKIVQIIILENLGCDKKEKEENKINSLRDTNGNYTMFLSQLKNNCIKYLPKIKTNCVELIHYLNDRNENTLDKFKSIELILPTYFNAYNHCDYMLIPSLNFVHENNIFDISNLYQIKKYNLKNVYIKLLINEENSRKIYEKFIKFNFRNIKHLEIIFDEKSDIYFSKKDKINNNYNINEKKRRINFYKGNLLLNPLFYQNNYLKNLYDLYKKEKNECKDYFNIFTKLEKSRFEYLYIGEKNESKFFYINKKLNSIGFILNINYFDKKISEKLSEYENVKFIMNVPDVIFNDDNAITINIFKNQENSKIKFFTYHCLNVCLFLPKGFIKEFPINFNNIISLEFDYIIYGNCKNIFPLFEKNCNISFPNLQILSIFLVFHCSSCIDHFPENLFINFGNNLEFCKILEKLSISINDKLNISINDMQCIISGIKSLKFLREFNLEYSNEDFEEINENEFYKFYPEYIKYCPFLNKIKIKIHDFLKSDLLYEKKIEYSNNQIIIKDYKYIKTIEERQYDEKLEERELKLFYTYLCSDKNDTKVIIRKFKKSRIKAAKECFENEKYCLKKFKTNPNVINYIEFLEDENYEYIVYEYIPNTTKYFPSERISRQIIILLYDIIYKNSLIDKNIILYPIKSSNILITKNLDIIITTFGYLNLFKKDIGFDKLDLKTNNYLINRTYINGFCLSHYLYDFSDDYFSNDLKSEFCYNKFYEKNDNESIKKFDILINILKQKNEYYLKYKNSLKFLPKFQLIKEIKNDFKAPDNIKMILKNDKIYIMSLSSIKIYNILNYSLEIEISLGLFNEKVYHDNLITFIISDNNKIICNNNEKLFIINIEKNDYKITQELKISDIKQYMNEELPNLLNNDNKEIYITRILNIKNTNNFITTGSVVCLWTVENKLKFIKIYDNLSSYDIFEFNDKYTKFVGINSKKIIFLNFSEKEELNIYKEFDYIFKTRYEISFHVHKFVQSDNKFFIKSNGYIKGFKVDFEKGNLINIFNFHHSKFFNYSSFLIFKYGLICSSSCILKYISFKKKKNKKYKGVDIYLKLDNKSIEDIQYYKNKLFVLDKAKLTILGLNYE